MLRVLYRKRKLFFSIVLALTVVAGIGISKLQFGFFRGLSIPESDPALEANKMLSDHFGGLEMVTFIVEAPDVLSEKAADTIIELTEDVKTLAGVNSPNDVMSLATVVEPEKSSKKSAESELNISRLLLTAPTNAEERAQLDNKISSSLFADGTLVNKDRTAALVSAYIGERAYPDDSIAGVEYLNTHFDEVESLINKYTKDGVRVSATSTPLVMHYSRTQTQVELVFISALGLLLMVFVFYLSFRSIRKTLLSLVVMLFAIVWTFGVMGLSDIPLTIASIYVIIVILAVGSSYSIHVISAINEKLDSIRDRKMAFNLAFFDFSLPLLLVSITSALSGISLLTFDVADIRELGVLQAFGITVSYLLTFLVLPLLIFMFDKDGVNQRLESRSLILVPNKQEEPKSFIDRSIRALVQGLLYLPLRRPFISSLLVATVLAVSLYGSRLVVANWVVEETIPRLSLPRVGYERIEQKFGKFRNVSVIVETKDKSGFLNPQNLTYLQKLRAHLSTIPEVKVMPSVADILAIIHETLKDVPEIPSTKNEIEQYFLLIGKKKVSRLLDSANSRALITVSIRTTDPVRTATIIKEIREELAKSPNNIRAAVGGPPIVVDAINKYMVINKIQSIILCLLIVFILCAVVNSSIRFGLIAVTPSAIAALMTFCSMGFAGIYLDIGTATITTIAIGVGVDFAIHFVLQFRSDLAAGFLDVKELHGIKVLEMYPRVIRFTAQRYGKTIVFDALSNIFGFGPLMLSGFPMLRVCGFLLALNQCFVIIVTFFVTPLLILLFKPDKPMRKMEDKALVYEPFTGA